MYPERPSSRHDSSTRKSPSYRYPDDGEYAASPPATTNDANGKPLRRALDQRKVLSSELLICNLESCDRIAPAGTGVDDQGAVVLVVFVPTADDD